jgi:hypothetical protein
MWRFYFLAYWDDTREREDELGVLNRANAFPLRLIVSLFVLPFDGFTCKELQ